MECFSNRTAARKPAAFSADSQMRRRVADIVALVQREMGPLDAQARAELARELTAMFAPQPSLFEEPRPVLALVPRANGNGNGHHPVSTRRPFDAKEHERFAAWWAIYQRKCGKGDAWAAWKKHLPPVEKIMATTAAYLESEEWAPKSDGCRPIPHPTTFLNGGRWDDEPTPLRPTLAPATQRMVDRTGGF